MSKKLSTALMMLALSSASTMPFNMPHIPEPKAPKYPFTEDELETLAAFENIKEKKKYLKMLKKKYS